MLTLTPEAALARLTGRLLAHGVRHVTVYDRDKCRMSLVFFYVATKAHLAIVDVSEKHLVELGDGYDEFWLDTFDAVLKHAHSKASPPPSPSVA